MRAITTRVEHTTWQLAIWSAVFLLFASVSPPTTWVAPTGNPANAARMTEGFGWLWIATALGCVALVSLIVGRTMRRHVLVAALSLTVAIVAFGITAIGLARHWVDLLNGRTSIPSGPGWELQPAPFVPLFALIAAFGLGCALVLTISWLQPRIEPGNDVGHLVNEPTPSGLIVVVP
jgi:hypothetical protein